jgi:SAM-dependent methyltransferase
MGDYARHAAVWDWSGHDRLAEIGCWLILARRYGIKVLSAMCATGTVADALARQGLVVTAVDITKEMVAEGKRRYGSNANLTFIEGDICDLSLCAVDYDFAFISTTDLHHLHTSEAREDALASLAAHTRQGGGLGLELWYPPEQSFASPWREFGPVTPPAPGEPKVWKKGKTEYDAASRLVNITQEVFVERDGAIEQFPHQFSMKLFSREELYVMLTKAGYNVVAEYGSYDFEPWEAKSGKWIVEASKSAK